MIIQEKFINVGNIRTKYLEAGKGDPLLLIHGLGHWSGVWKYNIEFFAQNFHVIVPDVVGYGDTDKPQDRAYNVDFYIKWLADFIKALDLPNIILIGNSLGGGIIAGFTGAYPEKVNKLIVLAPAGIRKNLYLMLRLISLPLIGRLLARPSYRGIMTFWKATMANQDLIPEELVKEHYKLSKRPLGNYAMIRTLRESANIFGIKKDEIKRAKEYCKNITIPTMVIWGDKDKILPMPPKLDILSLLPHAQIEIIENCGHCPMIETPEIFHKLVNDFL